MKAIFYTALCIVFGLLSACTSKTDKKLNNSRLLGTGFGINSATMIVKNLDRTRNYYAEVLGFDMPPPEKFEEGDYVGTRSAFVYFPDLSSLELLSVKDTGLVAAKHSFITSFWQQQEGVRLYSLSTSSADTTHQWINAQGFKTDSIQSGRSTKEKPKGWDYDDGGAQWRSLEFNRKNPPAYLPSFMEWVGFPYPEYQENWKPYSWRKYYVNHPNGVVGINTLRIVVSDLTAARKEFKKMGMTELAANDTMARFKIAHHQELHVMAPKLPDDALGKFLKTHGPGVYAIGFEVKNFKDIRAFLKRSCPPRLCSLILYQNV